MDREKVIKGLECCLPAHDPDCDLCPYDSIDLRCRAKLRDDIIALLKAQEPIEARLHLCESCTKGFPECEATVDDIEFGCGVGNDNIIGCAEYVNRWKAQETQRDYEASVEMAEYCERYEQTYDPETGAM